MLKAKKKLTRRQIKEDKFITYYFKSHKYVTENKRSIISGAFFVAVIIIGFFIFSKKQVENEGKAIVELTKAKSEYFANNYENAVPLLRNLLQNYSGTKSGKEGMFYLANAYFSLKDFANAEASYREFLDKTDDDILNASALAGVAACLEEGAEFVEAAELYQQAAEKYGDGFMAPENLLNSARCYSLAGKKEAAQQMLGKLIEDYPKSRLKSDAEIMLAELDFSQA